MCGICGLADLSGESEVASIIEAMNDRLVHRGPDDQGVWVSPQIAVGMRRLSIIDLKTGQQPIFNEDGTKLIVFNGEIYNHAELRQRLQDRGHRFQTNSDTEVILHGYEEYGDEVPIHLKGMFAFCIVNIREQSLFLARDRFGEKPLYFWQSGLKFAFASELPSLLAWDEIPRHLDLDAFGFALRQMFPSPSTTFFRDIRQLLPGHSMTWQNGWRNTKKYFTLKPSKEPVRDEKEAIDLVSSAIRTAVSRQRMADVPVGAFLSGGIDSSIIVAALSQISDKVSTYTARVEDAGFDESPIARNTAKFLGTDHHEVYIPNQSFELDDLLRVVKHVGQPFVDSSAIPTYLICREIRKDVKVCLSGDGGDEMFAGYPFYIHGRIADRLSNSIPRFVLSSTGFSLNKLARVPFFGSMPRLRQARRILASATARGNVRARTLAPFFEENEVIESLQSEFVDAAGHPDFDEVDAMVGEHAELSRLRQLMAYRLGFELSEDMLVKVDRMSMAASLEVRAPFLDVEIARASSMIPDHMLIQGKTLKYISRQVGRQWLPKELFERPKSGFSIPLQRYFNDRFKEYSREIVFANDSLTRQIFKASALEDIYARGLFQKVDDAKYSVYRSSHQLWCVSQIAAWAKLFNVTIA